MSASDNLNMRQFSDIYEMGHGDVGTVPLHALHDVTSAEYLVPAHQIPKAFTEDPPPHHTPESMDALTRSVKDEGIHSPISISREWSRFKSDPEHWIADGSHRYLAAHRNSMERVPVKMDVRPA